MGQASDRLAKHRERQLKQGESAASYAKAIGLSPQRIAKLIRGATEPTLSEAYQIKATAKINPALWLQA